jgi:NitT/TauT family transport system substrate-binding protein
VNDKEGAAEILLASLGEGGFTRDELVSLMNDPNVKFTTTPENVMKYAEFMHDIGSIKKRPASWKDLFFPEVQDSPGS